MGAAHSVCTGVGPKHRDLRHGQLERQFTQGKRTGTGLGDRAVTS